MDAALAAEVDALLSPLSADEEAAYFGGLQAAGAAPGLAVRRAGVASDAPSSSSSACGKGLFALRPFAAGDTVLREAPLVAIQQAANKRHADVCARCFRFVGSVERQLARRLAASPAAASLPLAGLAEGSVELPLARSLRPQPPPAHPCPGGCAGAAFCGPACAAASWAGHHRLLCPGPAGESPAPGALAALLRHTERTNDVFGLVANLLASVSLDADARLAAAAAAAAGGGSSSPSPGVGRSAAAAEAAAAAAPPAARFDALLAAWRPFRAAHRAAWADCVSRPDDVGPGAEEAAFRSSLAALVATTAARLGAALPGPAARYPALFSAACVSHVVGMVELNNLDVVVESPVERLFLAVDDLPPGPARDAALAATGPLLDALGAEYATPMDGTGFYPFVACCNHACDPAAASCKGEGDDNGAAVLVAVRDIAAGEEVTICYCDAGAGLADRRAALRDYGFVCTCARCTREEAAAAGRPKGKSK